MLLGQTFHYELKGIQDRYF